MLKEILISVVLVLTLSAGSYAGDCCGAYTDALGDHHEAELCADYCCINPSLTDYKVCCDDPSRQIPATENQNAECLKSWISDHVWVPIVGGIVGLVILIGICTCCCCCGCCACCRSNPQPVVLHTAASPTTTVAMASTTVSHNPVHVGYDQR